MIPKQSERTRPNTRRNTHCPSRRGSPCVPGFSARRESCCWPILPPQIHAGHRKDQMRARRWCGGWNATNIRTRECKVESSRRSGVIAAPSLLLPPAEPSTPIRVHDMRKRESRILRRGFITRRGCKTRRNRMIRKVPTIPDAMKLPSNSAGPPGRWKKCQPPCPLLPRCIEEYKSRSWNEKTYLMKGSHAVLLERRK